MKPIKFPEHTVVYAENQPEYTPLPAIKLSGPEGQVTSCWQLSWKERIKVLFTGKIWSSLMMFNNPSLTPQFLSTNKDDHFIVKKKDETDA